ncbi:MAG: hypothetical protein V8R46_02570 [Eubacterium ramulus]
MKKVAVADSTIPVSHISKQFHDAVANKDFAKICDGLEARLRCGHGGTFLKTLRL